MIWLKNRPVMFKWKLLKIIQNTLNLMYGEVLKIILMRLILESLWSNYNFDGGISIIIVNIY